MKAHLDLHQARGLCIILIGINNLTRIENNAHGN